MSTDETSPTTEGSEHRVDLPPRPPPTCLDPRDGSAAAAAAAERSRIAWAVAVVFEGLLLAWLVYTAWADFEEYEQMGLGEGLGNIGIFAGLAAPFVVVAALVFSSGRKALSVIGAAALLFVAGFIGFVGGFLILLTRSDAGDH